MARPRKVIKDKKAREQHERALAKRRERHAQAKGLERAKEASEGEVDMTALIAAEKQRMTKHLAGAQGGAPHQRKVLAARENLALAFDLMGGVPALVVWGRQNPTEFYRLWARLIPKESVEVTAQLPLEALLEKLSNRESSSVMEAAHSVGTEVMIEARARLIEHDKQNPDAENPYDVEDEETIQ